MKKLSQHIPLLSLWGVFLVLCILGMFLYQNTKQQIINDAKLDFQAHIFSPKKDRIEQQFRLTYQTLRTVGLLPGIRNIQGQNRFNDEKNAVELGVISQETYSSIQQLYNNLAKDVPVSEIYVVLDPIDPKTQIPLLMYDELILEDTKSSNIEEELNPDFPEEYEGEEYHLYQQQLNDFQRRYPTLKWNNLDSIPALSTSQMRTCDNSQYQSLKTGHVEESFGFAISVPFYKKNGKLGGMVSAILRKNPFEAFFQGRERLAITTEDSLYLNQNHQALNPEFSPFFLYNPQTKLEIKDRRDPQLHLPKEFITQYTQDSANTNEDFYLTTLNTPDQSSWLLGVKWPKNLATAKLNQIKWLHLGGGLLLCFLWILLSLWILSRQKHQAKIALAHRQIKSLLDNLGQAVIPINAKGVIQEGCTQNVENIFGQNPNGLSYMDLLQIPQKGRSAVQSWIELVFQEVMPFEDLAPLGPHLFVKDGLSLRLEYRLIRDQDSKPLTILCLATDVSREVALQNEAEEERQKARMILNALRDKAGFQEFISEAKTQLQALNQEIISPDPQIENLFRNMHTLKGLFASYHIVNLSQKAHELESDLDQLRGENSTHLSERNEFLKQQFKKLKQNFDDFITQNRDILGMQEEKSGKIVEWDHVLKILEQFDHVSPHQLKGQFVQFFVLEKIAPKFMRYQATLEQLSQKTGKKFNFSIHDPENISVYLPLYQAFIASWIHVFRNVADHGIELPEDRETIGKPPAGQVELYFSTRNDKILLELKEDGAGISPSRIALKAIEKGMITEEEINSLSDWEKIQLIFRSGFSTASALTETSGRGVGMEVLQYEAQKIGGKVWVESIFGQGSQFFAEIPIYHQS